MEKLTLKEATEFFFEISRFKKIIPFKVYQLCPGYYYIKYHGNLSTKVDQLNTDDNKSDISNILLLAVKYNIVLTLQPEKNKIIKIVINKPVIISADTNSFNQQQIDAL